MRPRGRLVALLFLAPNLLGFAVFTLVPVLLSFAGSFTNWNLRPAVPLQFIGVENYARLFQDPSFYFYLYNTGYMMLALPFSIGGALLLAVLLHDGFGFRKPGRGPRTALAILVVSILSAGALALTGSTNLAS